MSAFLNSSYPHAKMRYYSLQSLLSFTPYIKSLKLAQKLTNDTKEILQLKKYYSAIKTQYKDMRQLLLKLFNMTMDDLSLIQTGPAIYSSGTNLLYTAALGPFEVS